ncbi:MAG: PD-(D/E)XK nuclease family protein [Thermoleophilia bacterium]
MSATAAHPPATGAAPESGAPLLVRAPSLSAALDHGRAAWAARGGLLVVPRRAVATGLMLAEAVDGVVLDREAVTFAALLDRVAQAAGTVPSRPPSRLRLRLDLHQVLERADLAAFGPSARTPGFLTAVERAVGELRAARIHPDAVDAAAASPLDRAVAAVHRLAWERVRHPADTLWEVAETAEALDRFDPVTVVGYDDLVPGQWALLRALGRIADVTVVLPFAPGRAAYAARRERWAVWNRALRRAEAPASPPAGPSRLAAALFDDGPPVGSRDLRMVVAAGTRGMLRAAADEAIDAVTSGTPAERVAIVVPRLADSREELGLLLDDWGVAWNATGRARLLEAPIALALIHLLHLGEMGLEPPQALGHLLGWLRTPYSGADPSEVDRFEAMSRRASEESRGGLTGRWSRDVSEPIGMLRDAASEGPAAQLDALVAVGRAALDRAERGDQPVPSRADVRDRLALDALSVAAASFGGEADHDGDADDIAGRPRGPLPPGRLGSILADLTITVRDEGPGLHLHDYASIRGARYEVVVLAGLDSAGFPAGPTADPLIAGLRPGLGDALPARASGTSESRLRFVHAVDAARDRVVLVRRAVDDEGRELAPSPYWVEVARLAGRRADACDRRTGARGDLAETPDGARTLREGLRAVAAAAGTVPGDLAAAVARRSRELGVPAEAFRGRMRFRVTELEHYLRCPYGWFRDRFLNPAELDGRIDPRFEGTLAHEILHRLYARMRDEGVGRCAQGTLDRYRAALREIAPGVAEPMRPGGVSGPAYAAVVERLVRHIDVMLDREAGFGSGLVPTVLERRMEDARLLEHVAPGVIVSGQVDRLDIDPDTGDALVIDYKRRGGTFRLKDADVTKRLQLPLYGVLAANALDGPVWPIGGLYMGILVDSVEGAVRADVAAAPAVKNRMVDAESWERVTREAVDAARGAVVDIREGRLAPPSIDGCDNWCMCGDLWR